MSARANWFVEGTVPLDSEDDPFSMPVEEVGERIDLRDPEAELDLRLTELMRREGNLFKRGVTCPVKDSSDTTCHACPISKAHDKEDPKGILCRIGREQQVIVTELAVLQCREQ
jgi:hypothetical protein